MVDITIYVQIITHKQVDDKLRITWSDEHSSDYDIQWLEKRSFNADDQEKYLNKVYRPTPRLWGKDEFNNVIEKFEFNDIVNSKEGMYKR